MPQQFGPYELRETIGHGGMGEVHRAYHREQRREVAVKTLASFATTPEFAERFRRESHAVAVLTNPHVVPIHAFGEIDGRLYLEMRLVEGADLGEVIASEGPLPAERALGLLGQAADALDAAHRQRLIHRDVKPSNLLVTPDDFVYLVDFGIAYDLSTAAGTGLTGTGKAIGTFAYMAPERFEDLPLDATVDVYALACLLYETLTGRRPFPGQSATSQMRAHLYEPPPAVTALRRDLPPGLDDVIARGMAKDPARRYSSASELIHAARRAVRSGLRPPTRVQPPAHWTPPPPSPAPPASSRPTAAWAVAAAALVAVAVLVGVLVASGLGSGDVASGGGAVTTPLAPPTGPAGGASGSIATGESGTADTSGGTTTGTSTSSTTGDLGLATPISSPACTGDYAVFLGAATEPSTYARDVSRLLDRAPGSHYLLTSASCSSLTARSAAGTSIYAVYLGPYGSRSDACSAVSRSGGDSYAKRLDTGSPDAAKVSC